MTALALSKASLSEIVVTCIFFAWALVSLVFWCVGFEKGQKAKTALELVLKYSPRWWRIVTWIVFALVFSYVLFDWILRVVFKR